ncbi:LysR family transcriptional regulator [Tatumella saanichensis]|uniref:LysR family transcriptional regulator n=1 Tax=Tatumella saanichensis TaxID=480813 RepID=UPI0004B6A8A0
MTINSVDMNLLKALDVLLTECSVTRAAGSLGLSVSAMSRTLSRLRKVTGDPLLVQAGRELVPTPYALSIRERVHDVRLTADELLQPAQKEVDPTTLERTFTIRANEGFIDLTASQLAAQLQQHAPRVCLRFVLKEDKDALPLREGSIDLEIGVADTQAPEIKTRSLFRDQFVAVCRSDHPLLQQPITAERYVGYPHVVASRRGHKHGPVDPALAKLGLQRHVAMVVPSFSNVMRTTRQSDLIGLVPSSLISSTEVGNVNALGLTSFPLPVNTPEITISALWHPRLHNCPQHRWLRETIRALCQQLWQDQSQSGADNGTGSKIATEVTDNRYCPQSLPPE